ncbi:MAG: toprim domain-containing protein, partial [Deltaproteobacteria bacterium]|nr:toprim domain-containing protein [Deltaproteobacteria bacterium]
LLVGEGIETVLSLVTAVPEITAAAALSAGSLGAFSPPPACHRLVIARDNDFEGAWAAERLARRCAQAGVAAAVIVPEGGDFNDDLASLGAAVLAARLGPLFRSAGGGEEQA